MRRRIQRTDKDKPPIKFKSIGNRFCVKCGNFRPLQGGRKCPFCLIEDTTTKLPTDETNLTDETKRVLKEMRDRRRDELKRERTITEKAKVVFQLDRKNVNKNKSYYKSRYKKFLRVRQAAWLCEQLEMLLTLFEPNAFGGYDLYADAIESKAVEIRALKIVIMKIKRTFIVDPEGSQRAKTLAAERARARGDFDITCTSDIADYVSRPSSVKNLRDFGIED